MAVTTGRVNGRGVQIIASTAANATSSTKLTNWTEISVDEEIQENDATAASSDEDQFDLGTKKATVTVSGFVGGSETMLELPTVGDMLQTINVQSILTGNPSLIRSLAGRKVVVIKTNYKQDGKPGTYSFTARTGYAGGIVS